MTDELYQNIISLEKQALDLSPDQENRSMVEYLIAMISSGGLSLEDQGWAYYKLGLSYLQLKDVKEADKSFQSSVDCIIDKLSISHDIVSVLFDSGFRWRAATEALLVLLSRDLPSSLEAKEELVLNIFTKEHS